ncbi:3-oxoacyl-reductase FabG-like protein [Absidia repens]|uniref:3-oxoacyl-reductase FabG-like protein n=1 Tax=Absidia repens TaxID=90262 RepID=A0A1X2IRQ6_9FUNG|nr:3-oxoacyl-reductase FabG-like protein [Absidia repens]
MVQTVIITGGTRGLGLAIAHAFAKLDKKLILIGRDPSRTAAVQQQFLDTYGEGHQGIVLDISDKATIDSTMKELVKGKNIDVLVNAAGISRDGLLLQVKENDVQDVINTNLLGTMYVTQHVAKAMVRKRKGGCIINLSSVIGLSGNIGQCVYSASKAGIIGFTKSLAKELGPSQIRVNAIAPGFIETDMTAGLLENPEKKSSILASIPLRRFGQPEDIAEAALFIEKSKYLHGQVIQVDGGLVV